MALNKKQFHITEKPHYNVAFFMHLILYIYSVKLNSVLILLVSLPILCVGQQPIWKIFNENNGLPVHGITAFTQTSDGLMWVGSQEGVFLFDGIEFKQIQFKLGNGQPYIEQLITDKNDNVWCATRQGLLRVNRDSLSLDRVGKHNIFNTRVKSIVWNEDTTTLYCTGFDGIFASKIKNDVLQSPIKLTNSSPFYLTFNNKKLNYIFNNALISISTHPTSKEEILSYFPAVVNAKFDFKNKLWVIITQAGNFVYNPATNSSTPFATDIKKDNYIAEQLLFFDNDNSIWITTYNVIYKYSNYKDLNPEVYNYNINNPHGALLNPLSAFNDKDGNIWLGYGQHGFGVLFSERKKLQYLPAADLHENATWSCYFDSQKQITIYGTIDNVIVCNSKNEKIAIKKPEQSQRFTVVSIQNYDSNHWLVLTFGSGAWLLNKNSLKWVQLFDNFDRYQLNHSYRLNNTAILLASTGGVYLLNINHKTIINWNVLIRGSILFIEEIDSNSLFIATSAGYYITNKQGKIIQFYSLDNKKLFPITGIYPLQAKRMGNKVFIATMNGGVWQFDLLTKKFETVQLTSNPTIVCCIAQVGSNRLIFSGSSGLILYDLNTQESVLMNKFNGLPFSNFEQFGAFSSLSDLMFIGPEGVLRFPHNKVTSVFYNSIKPTVIYHHKVVQEIVVNPGNQQFSCEVFTNFKNLNTPLQYTYRLVGLEDEVHVTTNGEVNYNYVPPGKYNLEVTVNSINGNSSPTSTSIMVVVLPVWYQTVWFKLLCSIVALIFIVYAARYFSYIRLQWNLRKLEAQKKVAEERLRISRELHDNVGSQLTYLVTGLEASEYLLDANKEAQLKQNIGQLQQSARESMQQLRDSIWALNLEEMKLNVLCERFTNWAEKLTSQTKVEFHSQYQIENNSELDAITALNIYRILQEAFHNSIKHAHAKRIALHVTSKNKEISLKLTDDGIGIDDEKKDGNGLINMKIRAEEIGAFFQIESHKNMGTTVTLIIHENMPNG